MKARLLWLSEVDGKAGWRLATPSEQDAALEEWNERTRPKRLRTVGVCF